MKRINRQKNIRSTLSRGFTLLYSALVISVLIIISGTYIETTMLEISVAHDERESLKAFYAADAGIECVRHFQGTEQAFDTMSEENTYECGPLGTFTAGLASPSSECTAHEYDFTLDGFDNGACAEVHVEVIPREINIGGDSYWLCDLEVISRGYNTCEENAPRVERTRWELM